jgi:hypothetical protein
MHAQSAVSVDVASVVAPAGWPGAAIEVAEGAVAGGAAIVVVVGGGKLVDGTVEGGLDDAAGILVGVGAEELDEEVDQSPVVRRAVGRAAAGATLVVGKDVGDEVGTDAIR